MAVPSKCGDLKAGQNSACINAPRRYSQQLVLINMNDILTKTLPQKSEDAECTHFGKFKLKPGKKGFKYILSENGSNVFGQAEMSMSVSGQPQYNHIVSLSIAGSGEEAKCILEAMANSRMVAALQIGDTIELYGLGSGLSALAYTYDPQANGGHTILTLGNGENKEEASLPTIYKSEVEGQEIEDFDSDFAATI